MHTWEHCIKYNLEFLTGKRKETFYHGPLDDETLPLLGKLIRVNKHGFFSVEGQPGTCTEGFTDKTWIDERGKKKGNWFYKIHQKSYIRGVAENTEITKKLKNYLKSHPEVYVMWLNGQSESRAKNKFYSNFPTGIYNVSKDKHKRKGLLKTWSKWRFHTNISDESVEETLLNDYPVLAKGVFFVIAFKEFCTERSVEDVLLEFYESK
jgi:hypothetical protein